MKHFIVMLFTALDNATGGVIVPELTFLEKLSAQLAEQWAEMLTHPVGSKEAMKANLAVYNTNKLIDAENAKIAAREREQAAIDARNAKIAKLHKLLDSHNENNKFQASKATADEKAAHYDAYKLLLIEMENIVAGAIPTVKAATTSVDKQEGDGTKGATGKAIIDLFLANRADGLSDTDNVKAIIAKGYSRGTTGAVVLAWQRANGEKA